MNIDIRDYGTWNRYRIDYYINDKIVGFCYSSGWNRREAYYDSWNSKEYKAAQELATKKCVTLMWDASRLNNDN